MKKLEDEFNLASDDQQEDLAMPDLPKSFDMQEVQDAMSISEKINAALAEVRGMEVHDSEMDEIAKEAMKSYADLMSVGFSMTDMAAGPVFSNAAAMLKIALEAKDSKVTRKLKQIDHMIKKAALDHRIEKSAGGAEENNDLPARTWDRNDLLKMINGQTDDEKDK